MRLRAEVELGAALCRWQRNGSAQVKPRDRQWLCLRPILGTFLLLLSSYGLTCTYGAPVGSLEVVPGESQQPAGEQPQAQALKLKAAEPEQVALDGPAGAAAGEMSPPTEELLLRELANRSSNQPAGGQETADEPEEAAKVALLLELIMNAERVATKSPTRLSKRSGISDQRLAEIQMIRALKKQLVERASKLAANSAQGSSASGGEDASDASS